LVLSKAVSPDKILQNKEGSLLTSITGSKMKAYIAGDVNRHGMVYQQFNDVQKATLGCEKQRTRTSL